MKEQESYMNSISAKLNALKENIKGLFLDLGNTDFIKGTLGGLNLAVSGVRKLVNVFGGLPTVIGLATGAMTMFNKEFRGKVEDNIAIIGELKNKIDSSTLGESLKGKIEDLEKFQTISTEVNQAIKETNETIKKTNQAYGENKISTQEYTDSMKELKKYKRDILKDGTEEIKSVESLNKAYSKGSISIGSFGMKLTGLRTKLTAVKLGMEALKIATIALEGAMTMGLSLLASFAVEEIVKFFSSVQKAIHMTSKQLAEFNEDLMNKFSGNVETVSKAQKLIDSIDQTKTQIGNTKDEAQQVDLKRQLLDHERELARVMPEAANGFDQEGHSIVTNTDAVKANIVAKRQAATDEAREFMKKNRDLVQHINLYIENTKKIESLEKEKAKYIKENENKVGFSPQAVSRFDSQIDHLRDKIKNYSKEAADAEQIIDGLSKLGVPDSEIKNIVGANTFNAIKKYNDSMYDIQKQQYAVGKSSKSAGNSIEELTNKIKKQSKEVTDAAKSFDKYRNELKVIKDAMDELRKHGRLSADTVSKIFNTGDPRLIATLRDSNTALKNMSKLAGTVKKEQDQAYQSAINNASNMQNTLNSTAQKGANVREKMAQNEANVKSQTYQNDVNNQGNAEGAKVNNTINASDSRTGVNGNEVNNNAGLYGDDVNNHGNSESGKTNNTVNASESRLGINGDEQDQKAEQYGTDVDNHKDSEKAKLNNANGAGEKLVRSNDNVVKALGGGYGDDVNNWRKALRAKLSQANTFGEKVSAIFSSIWEGLKNLFNAGEKVSQGKIQGYKADTQNLFGNLDLTKRLSAVKVDPDVGDGGYSPKESSHHIVGYDNDYDSGSSGGRKGRKHSGGSGYKPKKYKSSGSGSHGGHSDGYHSGEQVNIEDIETEADRYKSLNDAINDINNSLDEYKAKEELANSDDKLRYFEKEIDLNKDKKNAIDNLISAEQKEARELENKLTKQGLKAHDGNIDNYKERLDQIRDRVNSMSNSNKAKEKAKKDYDELVKAADRYFELTSNEIPKLKQQWLEVDKTIRDTRKEYITMMADTERNVTDIIKNELEKRKTDIEKTTDAVSKAIDEEQKLFDNKNDDEEFQRQLAEKQDALNKITSNIDAIRRDDSAAGQTKLQDLLQQKQEAEKDLNDFLRDRQKTEADKAFDNEKDKLDKLREDKLKEIEDTYTPEKITNMAKDMIKNGYAEIEGEVIKLSDAITNYYKDQGDLFADSSLKMQDFIDKLKMTNKLYKDLLDITKEVGVKDVTIKNNDMILQPDLALKLINLPKAGEQKPSVTVKSELNVGTVNKADVDELRKMLNDSEKRILDKIIENMSVR